MKNYKANVSVKKGKKEEERVLYIRSNDIIDALKVTRKVKATKVYYITPITHEQYTKGVARA